MKKARRLGRLQVVSRAWRPQTIKRFDKACYLPIFYINLGGLSLSLNSIYRQLWTVKTVTCLEVSVDDSLFVHVVYSFQDLPYEVCSILLCVGTFLNYPVKQFPACDSARKSSAAGGQSLAVSTNKNIKSVQLYTNSHCIIHVSEV